jgi:hypothetical protein
MCGNRGYATGRAVPDYDDIDFFVPVGWLSVGCHYRKLFLGYRLKFLPPLTVKDKGRGDFDF